MIITLVRTFSDTISGFYIFLFFCILTQKKQHYRTLLLMGMLLSILANIILGTLYDWIANLSYDHDLSYLFFNSLITSVLLSIFIQVIYKKPLRDYIFSLSCSYAIYILVYMFSYSLSLKTLYPLLNMIYPSFIYTYLAFCFPFVLLAYGVAYIMKKFQYHRIIVSYYQTTHAEWKTYLLSFSLFLMQGILHVLFGTPDYQSQYFFAIGLVCFMTFLFCSSLLLRLNLEQEKNRSAQYALAWQNTYNQTLENIQKEVRSFRHDYKNMLSSLVLNVRDGQMEAAELNDLLIHFDTQIDEKMKLTRQLSHVGIIETKSLLMNKLTLIEQYKIPIVFEVLYPFDHVGMSTLDFNRCLGILIDNAIEEVHQYGGDIMIVMLREEHSLSITIENTLMREVDILEVYHEAYSSKGSNRGIGLSNYRHLVEKYDNVCTSTLCQNHRFLQELRIEDR